MKARATAKTAADKRETKGRRIAREIAALTAAIGRGEHPAKRYTVRTHRRLPDPSEYGPAEVRRTREALGVSQTVFASIVGASPALVQSWEQGFRKPSKMACRLLDEINRGREHWRRLLGAA